MVGMVPTLLGSVGLSVCMMLCWTSFRNKSQSACVVDQKARMQCVATEEVFIELPRTG